MTFAQRVFLYVFSYNVILNSLEILLTFFLLPTINVYLFSFFLSISQDIELLLHRHQKRSSPYILLYTSLHILSECHIQYHHHGKAQHAADRCQVGRTAAFIMLGFGYQFFDDHINHSTGSKSKGIRQNGLH